MLEGKLVFEMVIQPDGSITELNLVSSELADQELGVIAKSQVYFKRPFLAGDPAESYFGREDGIEEYGSAFNPYWHAHLVETSYLDRFTRYMQHVTHLVRNEKIFNPVTGDTEDPDQKMMNDERVCKSKT